jgi:DNA-binding CsgD family transcriptional regulator
MKTKSLSSARAGGGRTSSGSLRGSDEGKSGCRAERDRGCSLPSDWSRATPRREILREDSKPCGRFEKARANHGVLETLKASIAPGRSAPSRTIDLSALRGDATICNGSDVIIVVVLAENSCECGGFDQDALQDCRSRRITVDGRSMTPTIIQTLRVGGSDVIGTQDDELLAGVARALERHEQSKQAVWREDDVKKPFASLTVRQREIMDLVLAGHANKIIAADLGISQRTVENHRASIMKKTGAKSLPALVRLAMVAERAAQAARTSQH